MSDNQEEYVSRNQYRLVRGRINQLIDEEPSAKQMVLGMECILQKLSQMKQKKLSKWIDVTGHWQRKKENAECQSLTRRNQA